MPRSLPERLAVLWKALDHTPKGVEEIQRDLEAPLTVQECTVRLMELCLTGKAKQVSPGQFCRG